MRRSWLVGLVAAAIVGSVPACTRGGASDGGPRQLLQNKGSDTLVNVAQAWAEEYKKVDPSLAVAVSGGGSGTGIAALINKTVDIANSSRVITDKEKADAQAHGVTPVEFVVGYDALAVFVHRENPLTSISIPELAAIFGEGGEVERWSQIGIQVPGCPSDELVRVSRQNNSGTYAYFNEAVLAKKDFKLGSRDMHGSKDVVDLVMKTPCAMGYSGLAYAIPEVRMLCISKEKGGACVEPNMVNAANRSYPIARPLIMYTDGQPNGSTKAYLDWVLSDPGQCIIYDKGYAPATQVSCK